MNVLYICCVIAVHINPLSIATYGPAARISTADFPSVSSSSSYGTGARIYNADFPSVSSYYSPSQSNQSPYHPAPFQPYPAPSNQSPYSPYPQSDQSPYSPYPSGGSINPRLQQPIFHQPFDVPKPLYPPSTHHDDDGLSKPVYPVVVDSSKPVYTPSETVKQKQAIHSTYAFNSNNNINNNQNQQQTLGHILQPLQVKVPHYVLAGQTVNLYCNFSLPPYKNFYSLKWFHDGEEIYRLIPGAKRDLQRMVFKSDKFNIDITSSKMINSGEHLLVIQMIMRKHSGVYKCQVTEDSPPFAFSESSSRLIVIVLPDRHPVISGVRSSSYQPGDRLSINCTSRRSYPAASLYWYINNKKAEKWMLNPYITEVETDGLETSTLGLSFLVLPGHYSGADRRLVVSCKAVMPAINGEQIPLERTLMLGQLLHTGWSYQESWSSSHHQSSRIELGTSLLLLLLLLLF